MKKFTIPILSALFASAFTIFIFLSFYNGNPKSVTIEQLPTVSAKGVLYTADSNGEIVPLDFTEISKKVMDAVVHISSIKNVDQSGRSDIQQLPDPFRDFFGDEFFKQYKQQQRPNNPQEYDRPPQRRGTGSGVIINSDGYIVTNNHVVADADEIEVALHNNQTYNATIIGTDPNTDLALIKINEKNLTSVPLVNSDNIEVGEWVLAIGNPFNLNSTVTAGIVSAKSRNINILREQYAIESYIQTDAAINPGNSGGALVNLEGGLVGINSAIASPTGTYAGYGFAVPSNIVNKVIEDLISYGMVQRGYLGVTIRNVTGNFAKEEGLDVTEGVYVDSVLTKSAADLAGIREGDVITGVDGRVITKSSELQEMVSNHRPGDEVELVVDRNGRTIKYSVFLQSIEGKTEIASRERGEMQSVLGAELISIDKEEAKNLNVEGGVKVSKLYPGKLRSETNIREGFIITKVNTKAVKSVEELTNIVQETKGGVMLEGFYKNDSEEHYYAFGL